MLAREYCDAANIKLKPVILSHHMLYGLKAGQAKMSKSDPDSAIFMEDTKADIERKLSQAYCPKEPKEGKAAKKVDSRCGQSLLLLLLLLTVLLIVDVGSPLALLARGTGVVRG